MTRPIRNLGFVSFLAVNPRIAGLMVMIAVSIAVFHSV